MTFHPNKCVQLPVTRMKEPPATKYHLHEHTLDTVDSTDYLGIKFTKNLSWSQHIGNISAKANKTLGFLRRNLKISSKTVKELAYKTFVRPILEYSSTVWDPHTKKDIGKIEKVQKRAARFVLRRFRNTSSVSDMISTLDWPTLKERRRVARLAMLFKFQHDLAIGPHIKKKLKPPRARDRRGHSKQLERVTLGRSAYRHQSFLPKTIREWNRLPQHAVDATTLPAFMARISRNGDDTMSSTGSGSS